MPRSLTYFAIIKQLGIYFQRFRRPMSASSRNRNLTPLRNLEKESLVFKKRQTRSEPPAQSTHTNNKTADTGGLFISPIACATCFSPKPSIIMQFGILVRHFFVISHASDQLTAFLLCRKVYVIPSSSVFRQLAERFQCYKFSIFHPNRP